jgi:hypothetical protein
MSLYMKFSIILFFAKAHKFTYVICTRTALNFRQMKVYHLNSFRALQTLFKKYHHLSLIATTLLSVNFPFQLIINNNNCT